MWRLSVMIRPNITERIEELNMEMFTGTLNDSIDYPMGIIHFESSIKPHDWIILKHLTAPRYKALRINEVIVDHNTVELIYRVEQDTLEQLSVIVDNNCNLLANDPLANEWYRLDILSLQQTGVYNFEHIINQARENEPKGDFDRSLPIYFETMRGSFIETKIDYVSDVIRPATLSSGTNVQAYMVEALEECVAFCWIVNKRGEIFTNAKAGGDKIIQVDIQFDK